MSGDTILVRLEAVGQRRFRRDMKVSSRAVAGLTKAHVRASKASKKHGRENQKLTAGLKVLGMVAGRAAGPQGVGMLAQALQSATVAAAGLTAAVGGLSAALGTLGSAAAKGLRAVADAAGLAASRLRELAGLLWNAIGASTVRGATAALAGMVPVLDRIRASVRGVASAFAAVGTSMSTKMGSFGEILPGPGAGLVAAGAGPTNAAPAAGSGTAGRPPGGKANAFSLLGSSTSKLGEVPAAAMPFPGLMTASIDEINKAALPGLIEGMGSLNEAFQMIADSGALQTIGTVLGDAFKGVGGAIKEVVGYLEKIGALGPAIMGVAIAFAAFKVVGFASMIAGAVNPLTLVIVGIGILAAGAIYAYQQFGWFRTIVDGAWNVLKSIGTWIIENWQLVLSLLTGPLGAAVILIATNFGAIKNAVVDAFNWVVRAVTNAVNFIKRLPTTLLELAAALPGLLLEALGKLPGLIAGVGEKMWGALLNTARSAFNGIAGIWNNTVGKLSFSIPGWVPVIGGKTFSMPTIPTFDTGGGGAGGEGASGQAGGSKIPGAPSFSGAASGNVLTNGFEKKALGGSIPGGPPYNDRVPSLLTPGEHVWTRGEVRAAGGHRAVADLRRTVGRGESTSSASPAYVSVEAPVQVKIGEGVLADAMANVHLKVQAGIPT